MTRDPNNDLRSLIRITLGVSAFAWVLLGLWSPLVFGVAVGAVYLEVKPWRW